MLADRLEMLVLAVAAGGYGERYPIGWRRWLGYELTAADGSADESGRDTPGPFPPIACTAPKPGSRARRASRNNEAAIRGSTTLCGVLPAT